MTTSILKYNIYLTVILFLTGCEHTKYSEIFTNDGNFCLFQFASEEYQDKIIAAYVNDTICMIIPDINEGWNLTNGDSDSLFVSTDYSLLVMNHELQYEEVDQSFKQVQALPVKDNYYYYGKYWSIGSFNAVALDVTWSDFDKLEYTYYEGYNSEKYYEHDGIKAQILTDYPFSKKYVLFGPDLRKYKGKYVWGSEVLEKKMNEVMKYNLGMETDTYIYKDAYRTIMSNKYKYRKFLNGYNNHNSYYYSYHESKFGEIFVGNAIFIHLHKN